MKTDSADARAIVENAVTWNFEPDSLVETVDPSEWSYGGLDTPSEPVFQNA